jgi:Flp pilus assembly protein TadG
MQTPLRCSYLKLTVFKTFGREKRRSSTIPGRAFRSRRELQLTGDVIEQRGEVRADRSDANHRDQRDKCDQKAVLDHRGTGIVEQHGFNHSGHSFSYSFAAYKSKISKQLSDPLPARENAALAHLKRQEAVPLRGCSTPTIGGRSDAALPILLNFVDALTAIVYKGVGPLESLRFFRLLLPNRFSDRKSRLNDGLISCAAKSKGGTFMIRPKNQAGQVLPLIAVTLTVLLGASGMAVDNGYWQYAQRQQQSAADAAAVGGAQALAQAGCPNQSVAQSAAQNDALSNGFSSSNVSVVNPPTTGAYAGNGCAVTVSISANHPSYFARLFGKPDMPVTTQATAQLVSNNNTVITLLGNNQTSTIGGNVSAPGGSIFTNGTFSCGSVTITAGAIGYAGTAPSCGKASFGSATPAPSAPVTNPCPEITACSFMTNNPPPATNCQTLQANMNPTIAPGCYNQLTVGGCGTVTLEPGVYVLNGTSQFSGSSFVGTGVTFYVTANGTPPDFSQATSATISPPTSGSYSGVLYYQVPANTNAPNFAGSSVHFSGLVYAPGAQNVNFNGAKGDYTNVVFSSADLSDASGYTFATPPPGTSMQPKVVLGQ